MTNKTLKSTRLHLQPSASGRVVDMTPEISQIPMDWGLIGELNIFRENYGTQKNPL